MKEKLQRKEHRNFESSETCATRRGLGLPPLSDLQSMLDRSYITFANRYCFSSQRYKNMMDACQVNLGAVSAAGQMPEEEISFCVAWSSILISEFQDCAFRQDHGIHGRYCYFQRQNCCCGCLSRFRKGQLERSCARQGIHSRDIYLEWNSAGRPGELTKPHCLWCLRVGGL